MPFASDPNVERFKFRCSRCGMEDTVPFQPRDDRPIYCHRCYRQIRQEQQAKLTVIAKSTS
jgi:CxxC-x17-CxxC domain-containing protein